MSRRAAFLEPRRLARPLSLVASALLHVGVLGLPAPAPHDRAHTPRLQVSDTFDVIREPLPPAISASVAPTTAAPVSSNLDRAQRPALATRAQAAAKVDSPAAPPDDGADSAEPSNAQTPAPEPNPLLDVASASAVGAPSSDPPGIAQRKDGAAAAPSDNTRSHAGAPFSGARPQTTDQRARYIEMLAAKIRRHHQYPYLARRSGLQGTVCLRVSLRASGEIGAMQVTCGRSLGPLVEAAWSAVFSAAPFAPLPSEIGTSLVIDLPIVFRLAND